MSLPIIGDRMGSTGESEGLPPGYTRLEYLQSTGTQYIKTDFFVPADGLYLWANVQFVRPNDFTAGNECFFDWGNVLGTGANFGAQMSQEYGLYNWWGNYGVESPFLITSSPEVVNSRNIYEVNDLTVSYGPHQLSIASNGRGVDSEVPFLIFGGYKNGTEEVQPFGRWNMRIFEMKLGLRDGTIVRHLVPVLDSNGRPCLYDLISGQTFRNGGTGEFVYKRIEELPAGLRRVEYVENAEVHWINSGIVLTKDSVIDCEIALTKLVQYYQGIYGANFPFGLLADYNSTRLVFCNDEPSGLYRYYHTTTLREKVSIRHEYQKIFVDGKQLDLTFFSGSGLNIDDGRACYIFDFGVVTSTNSGFMRLYSFSIAERGQVVYQLIPCIDEESKLLLYEAVSKSKIYLPSYFVSGEIVEA